MEDVPGGHTVLWVLAVLTAFLTATYMFRLLYMTFFGERRVEPAGPGTPPGHGAASTEHGARHHLHDAPPAMAIALVLLAVGAVVAGYVGVPHALGGHNQIDAFLEPSFRAMGAGTMEAVEVAGDAHDETVTELALMGLSTLVAFAGIGLATMTSSVGRPRRIGWRSGGAGCTDCSSASTSSTRPTTRPSCSPSSARRRPCSGGGWTRV